MKYYRLLAAEIPVRCLDPRTVLYGDPTRFPMNDNGEPIITPEHLSEDTEVIVEYVWLPYDPEVEVHEIYDYATGLPLRDLPSSIPQQLRDRIEINDEGVELTDPELHP